MYSPYVAPDRFAVSQVGSVFGGIVGRAALRDYSQGAAQIVQRRLTGQISVETYLKQKEKLIREANLLSRKINVGKWFENRESDASKGFGHTSGKQEEPVTKPEVIPKTSAESEPVQHVVETPSQETSQAQGVHETKPAAEEPKDTQKRICNVCKKETAAGKACDWCGAPEPKEKEVT